MLLILALALICWLPIGKSDISLLSWLKLMVVHLLTSVLTAQSVLLKYPILIGTPNAPSSNP
jgi:hypothetical protein